MIKSLARVIASVVVEVLKEWTDKLNVEGREREMGIILRFGACTTGRIQLPFSETEKT